MNLKTTLILLVLLAIGIAALLLTLSDDDTPTTAPKPIKSHAQLVLSADDLGPGLKQLQFHWGSGRSLDLHRQAGEWRITSPHSFPANPNALDEVFTMLAQLQGKPTQEDFGTAPDQPHLTFGDGEEETTIWIGKRLGGGRAGISVVQGKRQNHYVVQDSIQTLYEDFDAGQFYARSIDLALMPEIRRIDIVTDGLVSSLEQDDGRWWIGTNAPRERALERGLPQYPGINNYFHLIGSIKIKQHIDVNDAINPTAYGLDRPLISVTLIPINESAQTRVLSIGVPTDPTDQARYVSYGPAGDPRPVVFTLDTPLALALGQSATAFRDPRLITTPTALIQSITATTPANTTYRLSFNTDGTAELIENQSEPVTLLAPGPARLVTSLYDARAVAYLEQMPSGAELITSVGVSARLSGKPETFTIYTDPDAKTDNPSVLVRRSDEPVLLRVDRSAVDAIIDPRLLLTSP